MKKNPIKKLELSRETLRRIDADEITRAVGRRNDGIAPGCTSTAGPPCEGDM